MSPTSAQARHAALITGIFFAVCLMLSTVLPLWLDEVLQLIETTSPSLDAMFQTLPRNAGAAPLGYVVQHGFLEVFGYSVFSARLLSAIFGAGAVLLVYWLGVELGLRRPGAGAALFALFPIVLRYSTESRVHAGALLLSVLASLLFWRLRGGVSAGRVAVYAIILTAAIYMQPYAGFVGVAHLAWAGLVRRKDLTVAALTGLLVAGMAFLPWYFHARDAWAATVAIGSLHVAVSARTPLVILKELTGGGYWVGGASVLLAALALRGDRVQTEAKRFLLLLVVVPIGAALLSDIVFDYFVSARQFLWTLPALALLAAAGVDPARWWKVLLAGVAVVASVVGTGKYFSGPHEDWNLAAQVLQREIGQGDACVATVPSTVFPVYQFFAPTVRRAPCDARRVVVAVSPYGKAEETEQTLADLRSRGYAVIAGASGGGSQFVILERSGEQGH